MIKLELKQLQTPLVEILISNVLLAAGIIWFEWDLLLIAVVLFLDTLLFGVFGLGQSAFSHKKTSQKISATLLLDNLKLGISFIFLTYYLTLAALSVGVIDLVGLSLLFLFLSANHLLAFRREAKQRDKKRAPKDQYLFHFFLRAFSVLIALGAFLKSLIWFGSDNMTTAILIALSVKTLFESMDIIRSSSGVIHVYGVEISGLKDLAFGLLVIIAALIIYLPI